jgi:hypothetical protein
MMKNLPVHAICFVLLLVAAIPAIAEVKPLEPLDPITQKDASTLVIPGEDYRLIPNPKGGMLLLCGDRLAWLADDGVTLLREKKLPRHYFDLAPREGTFVAISKHDRILEVLDAKTLTAKSTITLTTDRLYRVVPHPKIPVCYITTHDDEVPFLMYDELTGDLRQDDTWFAREMVIDPTGSFAVAAYEKWIQVGEDLHFNGPNVLTTPRYDCIEMLIRYHLDKSGKPTFAELRDGVGGGMRGLAASHDRRKVTFLSFAGMSRKTLGGFDALDFKKLPTSFGVNEGGTPQSMDYHPVLPMVASPGKGSVVFFDTETGQPLPNRLAKTNKLDAEITYDTLHFSANGQNALLLYKIENKDEEGKEITPTTRVLVAAPLELSRSEQGRIARGPAEPEPVELPELPGEGEDDDGKLDLHGKMRTATMDWIKENSIFGAESKLSADVIRGASKFLADERGFWMILEGGLTQSGKTTIIAVHEGTFMTAELTDEQAKAAGLKPMNLVQYPGKVFKNERLPRRVLSIESPTTEKTTDGTIKGKAILTKLGEASHARFAMTLTTVGDRKISTSIHHMGNWLVDERSEKPFKFNSPVEADEPKLVVGFLQMAAFTIDRRNDKRFPLSDPVLLVTVQHPKEDAE